MYINRTFLTCGYRHDYEDSDCCKILELVCVSWQQNVLYMCIFLLSVSKVISSRFIINMYQAICVANFVVK